MSLIDQTQLKNLLDLLGVDTIAHVRQSYLTDSAEKLPKISQAIAEEDISALDQLCHSLKSASANMALVTLAQHFAAMENAAKNQDLATIISLQAQSEELYRQSVEQLNASF